MSTKDIKKEEKKQKEKTPRSELGKKPYWYLFLLANLIVIIGCAITFAYMYKSTAQSAPLLYLATLICNILAVIPAGFFVWLELKDLSPKIMHFQRKWLKFYIISASFFVAAIIFNAIFFCICGQRQEFMPGSDKKWVWIIYLVITIVLTLVAIVFQRYARYRIDLDVYRRKHGEEIKQKEDLAKAKAEEEKAKKPEEIKTHEIKDSTIDKPTGGLVEQMDK